MLIRVPASPLITVTVPVVDPRTKTFYAKYTLFHTKTSMVPATGDRVALWWGPNSPSVAVGSVEWGWWGSKRPDLWNAVQVRLQAIRHSQWLSVGMERGGWRLEWLDVGETGRTSLDDERYGRQVLPSVEELEAARSAEAAWLARHDETVREVRSHVSRWRPGE